MGTAFVAVLSVVALLLVGPYTFLPSLVGNMIANDVQENLGLAETPEVELENDAPLDILVGEFSGGEVSMQNAVFGGIRTDSVVFDLDPFDVDVRSSVISRTLQSEDLRGDLRIEVSEAEVSRLVQARAAIPVDGVELSEDEMLVNTTVSLLGNNVPVSVRGGVELEGRELFFRPGGVAIAGTELPQEVSEDLLGELDVSFEIEGFPNGTEIQTARLAEDAVILTGRME